MIEVKLGAFRKGGPSSFGKVLIPVEDIADHCVILQEGKIAAEGEPADLLRDRALLGRANLIHAHRHRHPSGEVHSHPHTHPHHH